MRKMVNILKCFGIANVDGVEEPVSILFQDYKISIQLEKDISNTRKIKHIDIVFHQVKDESQKNTIFLKQVPSNKILANTFTKSLLRITFKIAREKIRVYDWEKS